jgi:hypothetical protein
MLQPANPYPALRHSLPVAHRSGKNHRKAHPATAKPAGYWNLFSYYSKNLAKNEKRQSMLLGATAGGCNQFGMPLHTTSPQTYLMPGITLASGGRIAGDAMVQQLVRPALATSGYTTDNLRTIKRLALCHKYLPVRSPTEPTSIPDPPTLAPIILTPLHITPRRTGDAPSAADPHLHADPPTAEAAHDERERRARRDGPPCDTQS